MDTEIEDPELIFELQDHMGDCQCACENVVYGPGYTTCLQVGDRQEGKACLFDRKLLVLFCLLPVF